MTTVAPASNAVSWQQIDSTGRLLRAQYKADFGDPFCLMVKTGDNSWLAYSPGPSLLAAAQTLISSDAELILVAPSVGHSMGLTPWLEAFPQAKLTASRRTASHLGKKLQLTKFIPVAECQQGLPDWLQILELPDNFFGECWLRIDGDSSSSDANTRYWAACDSLMNLEKLSGKRLMDWLLKLYGLNTGLHFHARFRRSLKDKLEFREWALARLAADQQQVLIPCHGELYSGDDLAIRVTEILKAKFQTDEQVTAQLKTGSPFPDYLFVMLTTLFMTTLVITSLVITSLIIITLVENYPGLD